MLYLLQDRIIYYPQQYGAKIAMLLPAGGKAVEYRTAAGRQTAFYLPPKGNGKGKGKGNGKAAANDPPAPKRMWVVFNGNAALALHLTDLIESVPDPEAGYLLIDYPGYGECEGNPSPETILDSSEKALAALAAQLKADPAKLYEHLNVFGISIGTAAGLQLAVRHAVDRLVLISPFTSMMAMARRTVGWPICLMLRHRFDNHARLAELAKRKNRPKVAIFHGNADLLVPIQMGRELAEMVPGWVEFHEVHGAGHNDTLWVAEKEIIGALAGK